MQPHWVEGGDPASVDLRDDQDRHLIVVDRDRRHLYELWNVWYDTGSGGFVAGDVTNTASFRTAAVGVSLASPLSATVPNVFSYPWTVTAPHGGYVLFLAALKAGAIADGVVTADEILTLTAVPLTLQ